LGKVCANRVHPDVPRDGVWGVVIAQNVIVEFLLPERFACIRLECHRGLSFDGAHELDQIAVGLETFGEEMDVIGHQAVGMDGECVCRGVGAEKTEKVIGEF
jgi:hypothetical protein